MRYLVTFLSGGWLSIKNTKIARTPFSNKTKNICFTRIGRQNLVKISSLFCQFFFQTKKKFFFQTFLGTFLGRVLMGQRNGSWVQSTAERIYKKRGTNFRIFENLTQFTDREVLYIFTCGNFCCQIENWILAKIILGQPFLDFLQFICCPKFTRKLFNACAMQTTLIYSMNTVFIRRTILLSLFSE